MSGVKKLRKIQLGRETTAGTKVDATTIWRTPGAGFSDPREVNFVDEDIGYLVQVDRTYTPFVEGQIDLPDAEATFEQLPHILEMGIKTVTPSADGSGSGKIYVYPFPVTTANTIKSYTIEAGDDQQEEEGGYGFAESFKLSGSAKGAVMMGATCRVREAEPGTFTGTASLPSVEEILFQKGKLYIDNVGGTLGATQKSNTLLGFELNVTTGLKARYTGDGNLYFTRVAQVGPDTTLKITFEHDGTAVAEKANWRAETPRQVRLKFEGSALNTAGTAYTYKTLIIDLAGKWETFDAIGDEDGNDVVSGTFKAAYNATAALFGQITVVNELASLP